MILALPTRIAAGAQRQLDGNMIIRLLSATLVLSALASGQSFTLAPLRSSSSCVDTTTCSVAASPGAGHILFMGASLIGRSGGDAAPTARNHVWFDKGKVCVGQNCPFPPLPTDMSSRVLVGSAGGSSSVVLAYEGAWTATANDSFLHISAGSTSGTGSGVVVFSYDPFTGTGTRTGTLTIAGFTVTVTQAGTNYIGPGPVSTLVTSELNNPAGVAVDGSGNVYIADTLNSAIKEMPYAFVGPASFTEPASAGSDSLLQVLPVTTSLVGIFAPTSDQSWLTIGTIATGVINFSFTANTTSARTAHITVLGQQITVTQNGLASQTITFGALANQAFGTAPFTVSATASSGLTVSFNSQTTGVCTVSGTTVTLVAVGTCTIQATQAGNANYAAATPVNQSFQVTQATLPAAATPTFSPGAGSYASTQSVTISTATSGCGSYIYWNFTGTSMSGGTNSTTASVSTTETLYAQVIGCPGYSNSVIGSAVYMIGAAIALDTPACTQDNNTTTSATATCSTAMTVPAGDTIWCFWQLNRSYGGNQFVSIGDSVNGNYYAIGLNYNAGSTAIAGFGYFPNAAGATVTPVLTGTDASATHAALSCHTYKNTRTSALLDSGPVTQELLGTTANPTAGSSTQAPTTSGEAIESFVNLTSHIPTAGSGFTLWGSQPNSHGFGESEIQIGSTSTNCPFTASADTGWLESCAGILPSSASAAGSTVLTPMFNDSEDGSANGTTVTSTILRNGTLGGLDAWGSEYCTECGALSVSTALAPPMQSAVHLDNGTIYTDSSPTRSYYFTVSVSTGDSFDYNWNSYPSDIATKKASVGFWYEPTVATSDTGYYAFNAIADTSGNTDFVDIMLHSGQLYEEVEGNPNEAPVACTGTVGCNGSIGYLYTAGTLYWITEQYVQYVNSSTVHSLNIYTVSGTCPNCTLTLVSSQTKYATSGNGIPAAFYLGRIGDIGTPTGVGVYTRGIVLDYVNGHFPVLPGKN